MQDKGLSKFKTFSGHLQANGKKVTLTFSARIDHAGEVEFDFVPIALKNDTKFIMNHWYSEGSEVKCYSLYGKSEDGFEFKTDNLYFNSIGHSSSKGTGIFMSPKAWCSSANFYRKLSDHVAKPIICLYIKGFQNFRQLKSKCPLGTVTMDGKSSIDEPDTITGYIKVSPDIEPTNLSEWRIESDNLLEHLRRVMSFASASVLQAPIIEYFSCNDLEVVALSQVNQKSAPMRTIHFLNQQPVFDSAVMSYFDPPIQIKNLFFAIEWADNAEDILIELNEKLADLNRRSIFKKFKILVDRWSVPLDGINNDDFKSAKRARDKIVHQGQYYDENKEAVVDLWQHVSVVREIVVRIIFTAIGYKGGYCSYLGGYHEAQFPP